MRLGGPPEYNGTSERNMSAKARQRAANLTHTPMSELTLEVSSPNLSPKQKLLRRILALRDSIEADHGILSESYPLIRQAREK
jgi:hypothetical protein